MDISEITKDVYIHCFDDDFKYPDVLNALNICAKRIIDKMKCCENCKYYKPCVTVNETIGNECEDFYNGCNNSVIAPFGKWEIKE